MKFVEWLRAKRTAPPDPAPQEASGTDLLNTEEGLVPESVIAKVRANGRFDSMAAVTADRARWFAAFLVLGMVTFFSAFGWYVADRRFADNVRVAWVKLDPSGAYTVDFADDVRPSEFFAATLESKLIEFTEKRFRRNANTIAADYRFVGFFLSSQLARQFLSSDEFNAARVAAELTGCKANCLELDAKVRVVQHRNQTPVQLAERTNSTLYESLVFVTITDRKTDGAVLQRRNAIVQLGWRVKAKSEIVANKSALVVNPLGIEIVSIDLKEDPTPVSKDDKAP
jgi:hypothetical protein